MKLILKRALGVALIFSWGAAHAQDAVTPWYQLEPTLMRQISIRSDVHPHQEEQGASISNIRQSLGQHEPRSKTAMRSGGLVTTCVSASGIEWRTDFTLMPAFNVSREITSLNYTENLRSSVATLYADWFSFEKSGIRNSVGVGFNDVTPGNQRLSYREI